MTTYTKVEEIEVLVYVAEDGTEFYDEQECLAYESRQHVNSGVKNVFVYFDEAINGKGIYAIHSLKDFTSLSYVLGLSRTNQEIQGSDISYKSITATFDKYPFVIIQDPVTLMFKIQTVEKFKRRYEIEKIIQKMKDLENIMAPIEDTPVIPDNPPTGGEEGDNNENQGGTTTDPKDPVTPPSGNEGDNETTDPPSGTGSENEGEDPGTKDPVTDPETPPTGEDNNGENTGTDTPPTGENNGGEESTDPETPPTGEGTDGENSGETPTTPENPSTGETNETPEGGEENTEQGDNPTTPKNPETGSSEEDTTGEGGSTKESSEPSGSETDEEATGTEYPEETNQP